MSTMRAAELAEVPAALPQHSARSRAVARWTTAATPAGTAPGPAAPGPAAQPEAARGRDTHSRAARVQTQRPGRARGQAASVPLRLTRRGRVVVAVAAVLLLAVLSLVIAASAQATNQPERSGAAQQNLTEVTVRPGQSLWSVAENADPDADTRMLIQQIIELNGLTGTVVFAGQRLWVPRG
jgi:LysM domain